VDFVSDFAVWPRAGLSDSEGTRWLVKYLSVEGFNGSPCLGAQGHLDESESFRAAGGVVTNDGHRIDLAMNTKHVFHIPFAEFALEISHVYPQEFLFWPPAL